MKLSHKFILIAIPCILIITLTLDILIYSFTSSSIETMISTQQVELAKQTMDKIDRFLHEKLNNILAMSEDEEFEGFLTGKDSDNPKEIAESHTKLRELSLVTGPWDSLSLASLSGEIVLSLNKKELGENIVESHFSKDAFEKILAGEVYYSNVFLDEDYKKPTMIFSAPVRNEDDPKKPVIGIIIGHLAWPSVLEILKSTQGNDIELFNKKGVLIGSNRPENTDEILKKNSGGNKAVQNALAGKSGSEILNNLEGGKGEMLISYVSEKGFLNYTGNNWVLLVEAPTSLIFADARQNALTLSLFIIPMLLGAIIIIILLFQKIAVNPIVNLTTTTKRIAEGDLSKRVKVSSHDEIGQLGSAFNDMATKLQESYSTLEQKVQEKTAALAQALQDAERINKLTLGRELKLMEYKRALMKLTGQPNLAPVNDQPNVTDDQLTKTAMLNLMEDMQKDEAKIIEQKRILDSVVQNMPIGVALSETTGKPIIINDVGIQLLGKGMDPNATNETASEIYQIFKNDNQPYPQAELPTFLALEKGVPISKDDMVVHHSNGNKIALRGTSVPLKNSQGVTVSILSVFEDITKEREIDRMKTEFISLASHQLRTPLSAIKWFSEMLVGGDAGQLTAEQRDFAQNISDSTERMIDLVNSLLNISRIESGRIVVDPRPTDLKALVDGIVKELKVKIDERQQSLVVSVHNDLPQINLDPKLIRQVYMNLLTNAIKYTPKGGEISVFISKKDDEIISQITDNGYGIPKSQQTKIFQKFFRAENIIKVETDGTGLGLYLIKAIIESSHGKIWFESEEGKGTTFWFSLPMSGMEAKKGEVTLDE